MSAVTPGGGAAGPHFTLPESCALVQHFLSTPLKVPFISPTSAPLLVQPTKNRPDNFWQAEFFPKWTSL